MTATGHECIWARLPGSSADRADTADLSGPAQTSGKFRIRVPARPIFADSAG